MKYINNYRPQIQLLWKPKYRRFHCGALIGEIKHHVLCYVQKHCESSCLDIAGAPLPKMTQLVNVSTGTVTILTHTFRSVEMTPLNRLGKLQLTANIS